jgi:small-conductance mechanosensitive channel/CRP-like cAMP-binding protein
VSEPIWPGALTTAFALALLLVLRRIIPGARKRATVPVLFLSLALLARFAMLVIDQVGSQRLLSIADFVHPLALALGLSGTADIVLFDLILERIRIRVPHILRDILQAAAFFAIVLGLLGSRGVDLLPLVTTSAVLTAVIGLALQSTIANLFAGLALQLDRAFVIGDWITVGTHTGRIAQIRWRSTSIRTRDGDLLVLPNQTLTTHEVLNLSEPARSHRVGLKIRVDYAVPPNDVKRSFLEAVRGAPGVLENPVPSCAPRDFGETAIDYQIFYWIEDPGKDEEIAGDVRTRLYYAAKRAAFDISPPHRVMMLGEPIEGPMPQLISAHDLADRSSLLKRIDVLAPLEEQDRQMLIQRMRRVRFAAGETIIRQGEPGDSLYLIHLGEVAVMLGTDGGAHEVATLGPTNFFGEISLVTGEPRAATCLAKSDVVAYVVDHSAFQALLERRPELAEEISRILARRMTALTEKSESVQSEPAGDSSNRVLSRIREFFNMSPR